MWSGAAAADLLFCIEFGKGGGVMNENMRAVAGQAAELMPGAVATLGELMVSSAQPGPVRVAAAKAVIDYALKLDDKQDAGTLAKLDAILEEFRRSVGADAEPGDGKERTSIPGR